MKLLRSLLTGVFCAASLVTALAQPANDNLANRTLIPGSFFSGSGTTQLATQEPNEVDAGGFQNRLMTVYYEWVAPASTTTRLTANAGGYRALISWWTGSAHPLTLGQAVRAPSVGSDATINFTPVAGTSYKIQVDITGNFGVTPGPFSLIVSQEVAGPTVTLTAPANGQTFTNPINVALSATATPNGGTVTNVSFFHSGNVFIGNDTSDPYNFTWTSPAAGNYQVTAQATDDLGLTATSGAATILVRPFGYFATTLVATGSVWKYLDTGTDLGTAWLVPGFDDSGWSSGPAELGYGDTNDVPSRPEATVVGFGPDPNNKYVTTYFRRSFVVSNAASITNLVSRLLRDDGAAVYLNGVEIRRDALAAGAVFGTFGANASNFEEQNFLTANLPFPALVNGTNYVAVEIHQSTLTSTDMSFDLQLIGEGADGNIAPTVSITNPIAGAIFSIGGDITIFATAADSDGTVTNVAFYAGTNKLGDDAVAPFSFTWTGVPQGVYTLTAVASDDDGGSQTSAGVSITVNDTFIVPVTLIATGSVWKYLDNGSDQGTAWSALGFNDSSWSNGPAQLGYGEGDEATVVADNGTPGYNGSDTDRYITTYFRRAFTVTNAAAISNLTIRLLRDDGAVVYINGSEVRRDNLPVGTITNLTPALAAVGGADESTFFVTTTNATLNNGVNVLAVEIHQNAPTSSDISFDLELIANVVQGVSFTNATAPFVQSQNPAAGSSVSALSSVQVTFNESVSGVNAADLLVNGAAATGLSGGGNVYTFTFPPPALGTVNITWDAGHGIVDQDLSPLPFDGAAASNIWSYTLADNVAPVVAAKTPAAGASVTNLTSVNVTFSEGVTGVGAGDMLVNGTPASGVAVNSSSNYTFTFAPPLPGAVDITWIGAHGITDTSPSANPFNALGANATWSYTLSVPATALIPSNTVWRFMKGLNEASTPITDWRQLGFNDAGFSNAPTPFYYGDVYGSGTLLSDMQTFYQCIFLRHEFTVISPAAVSNLIYRHQIDDGLVAWINGVEVLRVNMVGAPVEPPYLTTGITTANEPNNLGAAYIFVTNTVGLGSLVAGTNVLAVQAFNQSIGGSSDFGFNLQFEATVGTIDPAFLPPRITAVNPPAGDLFTFTNLQVTFSENVQNVNAGDLRINAVAATQVTGSGSNYTFTFLQPGYGPVTVNFAAGHGIEDFDAPPKSFDENAPGASFSYTLVNPSAPTVAAQAPLGSSTVSNLTQVQVTFSEAVQNVNAADLLVAGTPATGLSGGPATYTFTFPQPAYGSVPISWAGGHGITDTEPGLNAFDASRPGATWTYTLIDLTAPVVLSQNPPANASVTNLTQLTVTFSEAITGVNASDLLINGVPATGVSGGPATFTFTFLPPNTSIVNISWAGAHGLTDTAAPANSFNAFGPGATWQYFTPDSVPPTVATILPPPVSTVRDLTQITVTFAEPVIGVSANDLIIGATPAQSVIGSGSGPYTFGFTQPPTGAVDVAWAPGHGITDLAVPPNAFAGGEWNYTLNPNAVFADKIVINEIMFHPSTEATNHEWFELHNTDTAPVNLTGWRITKGVNFTFPNVTIPAGGYLVVAANVEAFQIKYPGVINVVGGWAGQLGNTDEEIQIETVAGENVDTVHYADEGDWAVRQRGPLDSGARGWEWFSLADGTNFNTGNNTMEGGRTLELRNPLLPNNNGQNWGASTQTNGTPGVVNTLRTTNIAPMILDVAHFPQVPTSADAVTVTARIRDEATNGHSVVLFSRNHTTTSPGAFAGVTMFDDGAHNDGLAGDGTYGATIAAQAVGTVREFYVRCIDPNQRTNFWPAPARSELGVFAQTANALYQVDNEQYDTNALPLFRIIMTGTESAEYFAINQNSDAEMNATFLTTDGEGVKVRYLAGMRIRGAGSRSGTPKNNRVNIPSDTRWNGLTEINLNNRYTHIQTLGSALSLKSGLPTASVRPVQYRINGANLASPGSPQYGAFVFVEPINGDWAEDHYPNDGDGNAYRASTGAHNADFTNFGTNGNQYVNRGYFKTSNQSDDNWSDMNQLTLALQLAVPEINYVAGVQAVINVTNWMRYFAVCSLAEYSETALCVGRGDDYAMYRGVADPRFTLIPHDFDTIFGQGDTAGNTAETIWVMLNPPNGNAIIPVLNRFMRHPQFAPVYFAELKRLGESVFAPTNFNPLIDQLLGDWSASAAIPATKAFVLARTANVLSQIPLTYSLVHTLALSNGVARSTTPTITLRGAANAIDTRSVRVNGAASTYSGWEGRWTNSTVALQPGYNNLLVEFVGVSSTVFSTNLVVWYDTATFNDQSGAIAGNVIWSAGAGPYRLTAGLTVNNGATLTIQPGTTVFLNSGVSLTVANGGRLLAEGTPTAGLRFLTSPGPSNRWGGIIINGAAGSPESRLAYAHLEGNNVTAIDVNAGTVFFDHLTFGTTDRAYLDFTASSFVVSHCHFPDATAAFEPIHGASGVKAGGRAIFVRNFHGRTLGYNDTIDFTGGNRPGPILQVLDSVFAGSDDDILDIDGTDAWVEGNIFLHVHRNGSPDSASAVSGGNDSGSTSEITVLGNIFYDVDQAATAKQGNFYNFINNTVVHQSGAGFGDSAVAAVLNFADEGIAQALGMYVEGNIIFDAERLTRELTNATPVANSTTFHNNLMPFAWAGTGTNNSTANPLLTYVPQLAETTGFNSWESAQVLRAWFAPASGSPALGTGPNGRDKGGVIPIGASISGVPGGTNSQDTASLVVGPLRTGNSIPAGAAAFPLGSGFTHYKWRLDLGPWSAETASATPIALSGLTPGAHRVDVVGKRDSAMYQDDTNFGPVALVTESRTWFVNTNASPIRLNEILAANAGVLVHSATTPDAVELFNASSSPIDLNGMRLTDDASDPDKFVFPPGSIIPAGGYLVVYADSAATPGLHLEYTLSADGEGLFLYNSVANGGALVDSITFGLQLDNLSVGRLTDGSWNLCVPTFGAVNVAAALGDPRRLRINEWLASGLVLSPEDFVELFNFDTRPVALGGLYLSDEPTGWPGQHAIAPLSFIGGGGYRSFIADGNQNSGAEHLNFSLSPEQGVLSLANYDLSLIDCVVYLSQRVDVSQGRSPNGSSNVVYFALPTPGAPNPTALNTNSGVVINEVLANNQSLAEPDGTTPDWIEFHNLSGVPVDLSDMSITDDTLVPRRYIFAPGTTIGGLGYLRLRCDPDLLASATNTGFGLKSSGGAIYLFDKLANGGGLINAVVHGLQTADFSIGRIPNGTGPFALTVPSSLADNGVVGATLGDVTLLKVNEWLAAADPGEDDWFELYNPSAQPVAVGGLYLTDTLANRTKSQIPALSFIGGGGTNGWQRFWADSNPGAGADHVNFGLAAGGEALGFSISAAVLVDSITFGAQAVGVTEGRFPDGSATLVRFPGTESPGAANFLTLSNVVINEALAHTDLPFEDAIELRNLTSTNVNIGSWWLSDAKSALKKYRIPNGTIIPANGYAVFYEYQFNADTNDPAAFSLSSGSGDEIYLSAATTNGVLTGFRARVGFGASQNGVSFGRYLTSQTNEEFTAMSARSLGQNDPGSVAVFRTGTGQTNPYPKIGPVIIKQVQYHPPDVGTNDNSLDEFIELRNITGSAVQMFDPAASTNTWRLRDAVDFNFPPGVTIPANSNLVLVTFDPVVNPGQLALFRALYGIPATLPVYGPYTGKLANNDDKVELYRPDPPNPGQVPYVLVDRVHYYDLAPWTTAADGTGQSLQRVSLTGYANDPTNWIAALPDFGGNPDTDGDGMPNAWENQYVPTLNPNVNDAAADPDGDGMTNLQEYLAGTNPTQSGSALRITSIEDLGGNSTRLTFFAVSNKTYGLEYKKFLDDPSWTTLQNITAAPTNRTLIINTAVPTTNRFYRLRTP